MAQPAAKADADQACETWKRSTDEYARLPPSDEYVLALVGESQCRLSQRHYVLAWKTLETAADVAHRNDLHPVDLDFAGRRAQMRGLVPAVKIDRGEMVGIPITSMTIGLREIDINALDFVVLDEGRATLRVTAVGYKPLEIPIVGTAGTTTIVSLPKMEAEPEQSRNDGSARETVGVLGAAGVVLGGSALISWATAALFKRGVDEWACDPTCSSGWSNRKDDASSWQRYSLWTAAVSGGLGLTALIVAELMPSGRAPLASGTSPSRSGGHHSFQLLPIVTPQTTGLGLHVTF